MQIEGNADTGKALEQEYTLSAKTLHPPTQAVSTKDDGTAILAAVDANTATLTIWILTL